MINVNEKDKHTIVALNGAVERLLREYEGGVKFFDTLDCVCQSELLIDIIMVAVPDQFVINAELYHMFGVDVK